MNRNTLKVLFSFMVVAAFASCSRPVAYFQPTAREQFSSNVVKTEAPAPSEVVAVAEAAPLVTSEQQIAKANTALDEVDALVRNDSKLATKKSVQKRLTRVRAMLAETSTNSTVAATNQVTTKKMNLVERMMLKKMNKKIGKHLAPANPEKTMISSGTLATGAVLVIVGLLLLLLGSGTVSTIGLIALLVGAIVLLVGLL